MTIKLEIAPNQELYNPDDMKTVDAVFVAEGSFGATLIKSLADLEQVKFGQEARNDLHKGYEEDYKHPCAGYMYFFDFTLGHPVHLSSPISWMC